MRTETYLKQLETVRQELQQIDAVVALLETFPYSTFWKHETLRRAEKERKRVERDAKRWSDEIMRRGNALTK